MMTAKDKIYQALVDKLEWNHPYVWKGECQPQYPQSRNEWYAREFSLSNARLLGKSLDEALETIDEWSYEQIQQLEDNEIHDAGYRASKAVREFGAAYKRATE